MSHSLDGRTSPQRWLFFLLIAGLVLITALYLLNRLFFHSSPFLSTYSADNKLHLIELSQAQLLIPENTIRLPEQRSQHKLESLKLIMLWPDLEGFSREKQLEFSDVSENSRLIFVTLSSPDINMASSERLYSVYSQHFVGKPLQGPSKLIGFHMEQTSGYAGEVVYFKPDESPPYVVRCLQENEKSPSICMREITLAGKLQVSYRFRQSLLTQWRAIDQAVSNKIRGFVQN